MMFFQFFEMILEILVWYVFAEFDVSLYLFEQLCVELFLEGHESSILICYRKVFHILTEKYLHLEREVVFLVNKHVS